MSCSMPHEMQFIADELFIGNKLAAGDVLTSDGSRIDLRNIRSPIIVFCSKADNITPPPQALDWILDLYDSVDDIRAHGQTIVYAVHEMIGHLGIFVSGSVAKKEHDEFASNIDLIDVLAAGPLRGGDDAQGPGRSAADLISGDYLVRFEARTLDDIRALGGNDDEDDRKFAAVARVSEINLGLYRTFVQPWVRLWANEGVAEWMRRAHPLRLQYEMFSQANPFMRPLRSPLEYVRENRQAGSRRQHVLAGTRVVLGVDRNVAGCLSRRARPHVRGVVSRDLRLTARAGRRWPQGVRRERAPQARQGCGASRRGRAADRRARRATSPKADRARP